MRAIVCETLDGPESLILRDLPAPALGAGQVRIAVHAAAVNFADSLIIRGQYQEKPPLPFIPGFEIAGIVSEIAPDVSGLTVGDRVLGLAAVGGYADEIVLDTESVYRIPDSMSFAAAAGFPIAYGTSHGALDWRAHLQPGETLLVHGASGGVGLTAVEIGKVMGARVIATASTDEKLAIAASRGADILINTSTDDVRAKLKEATGGKGVDVAYDPVGGPLFETTVRAMGWEGRLVIIGFAGGGIPQIPANLLLVKNCAAIGFYWGAYRLRNPGLVRRSFRHLLGWVAEGKLNPLVTTTYPLERAAEAIALLSARKATGKVILTTR